LKGRRVVVTGLGLVSPLGNDVASSWAALLAGKSGAGPITGFDASEYPVKFCAEVKDFDPETLPTKDKRKFDLFILYAAVAAAEALADGGFDETVPADLAPKFGVAIGSGIGGLQGIEKNYDTIKNRGPARVAPSFIPCSIINMAPGYVAIRHGLKGPNYSAVSACTTGVHNIGLAARQIAYGEADCMLAGGTEKGSTPLGMSGFAAARALSRRNDDPEHASRPWDLDRDGFVLGDGAGVLLLEEYEHAKARGAKIYAELKGFGMSDDAHHITSPDPDGAGFVAAMQNALNDADLSPSDIDYVNAHGTSTPTADYLEAAAIEQVFAGHTDNLLVSSTKSMTGHLLGAAGALEAIVSVLVLRDGVVPPTINLENQEPDCKLDFVPNTKREAEVNAVISNSFGFGGTNACVAFTKVDD
jgi:3-oxoacyl-[acyl-carrier-protein] synthase II